MPHVNLLLWYEMLAMCCFDWSMVLQLWSGKSGFNNFFFFACLWLSMLDLMDLLRLICKGNSCFSVLSGLFLITAFWWVPFIRVGGN